MTEIEENTQQERAILVGVELDDADDFTYSMEELKNLAQACNMCVVGILTQKMDAVNKALYLGSGKVDELQELSQNLEADVIVFDNAL